jgi:hypothetical protein
VNRAPRTRWRPRGSAGACQGEVRSCTDNRDCLYWKAPGNFTFSRPAQYESAVACTTVSLSDCALRDCILYSMALDHVQIPGVTSVPPLLQNESVALFSACMLNLFMINPLDNNS